MPYSPFDLTGKIALVTGGNRGIGYGMAEALTQAGASVAIWGSNEKTNNEAEKKLGGKAKSWTVNVADETAVAAAMIDVVKHFGRVDTVIANAGVGGGAKSFAEFPTETYRRVLSVNLDGVFFTLARSLQAHGRARQGRRSGRLGGRRRFPRRDRGRSA